jgi:hypothetical protein
MAGFGFMNKFGQYRSTSQVKMVFIPIFWGIFTHIE